MIKGSGFYCMKCGKQMVPRLVLISEIYPDECPFDCKTNSKRMLIVDYCNNTTEDNYHEHFRSISNKIVLVDIERKEPNWKKFVNA